MLPRWVVRLHWVAHEYKLQAETTRKGAAQTGESDREAALYRVPHDALINNGLQLKTTIWIGL